MKFHKSLFNQLENVWTPVFTGLTSFGQFIFFRTVGSKTSNQYGVGSNQYGVSSME